MSNWQIGDAVEFATFDDDDADTRELDGTKGTILRLASNPTIDDSVLVESIYGPRWTDPYALVEPRRAA